MGGWGGCVGFCGDVGGGVCGVWVAWLRLVVSGCVGMGEGWLVWCGGFGCCLVLGVRVGVVVGVGCVDWFVWLVV